MNCQRLSSAFSQSADFPFVAYLFEVISGVVVDVPGIERKSDCVEPVAEFYRAEVVDHLPVSTHAVERKPTHRLKMNIKCGAERNHGSMVLIYLPYGTITAQPHLKRNTNIPGTCMNKIILIKYGKIAEFETNSQWLAAGLTDPDGRITYAVISHSRLMLVENSNTRFDTTQINRSVDITGGFQKGVPLV